MKRLIRKERVTLQTHSDMIGLFQCVYSKRKGVYSDSARKSLTLDAVV